MISDAQISPSAIPYRVLETPEETARAVAELLTDAAAEAQRAGRDFSVALSGGSTPSAIYRQLTSESLRGRIDWERVKFFFGDARSVGPDHPDSNFKLAADHLFTPLRIDLGRVFRKEGEDEDLNAAAARYEKNLLAELPRDDLSRPVLDFALQGLGPDGHTASLFPGTAALAEDERFIVANEVPQLSTWRLTMTYPTLLAARHVIFVVVGSAKAEVAAEILNAPEGAGVYPAAKVRPDSGQLLWVMDREAAGKLSGGQV